MDRSQSGESLTQQLALQANGTPFDSLWYSQPFDADLAWYTYLIDTVSAAWINTRVPSMATTSSNRCGGDRSGRMGRNSPPLFTTYNDVLHIGMAIGLTSIDMDRVDVYTERKLLGPSSLDQLTFNDRLQVSGLADSGHSA